MTSKSLQQETLLSNHALAIKNDTIKTSEGKRRLGRFPIVSTSLIVKKHDDPATSNEVKYCF